jgi:dTDP-4-dehydrorhamnose 3,5-epimerase-like enzyme
MQSAQARYAGSPGVLRGMHEDRWPRAETTVQGAVVSIKVSVVQTDLG